MPAWAAWIVGLALMFLVGLITGFGYATEATRATIANEFRKAEEFTVKRTGFKCEVIR